MMYATETVMALHRARIAEERRSRARRRARRVGVAIVPAAQPALRPAAATR